MNQESPFSVNDFVDTLRITSNAAITSMAFMDTICSFESGNPICHQWRAVRPDILTFPAILQDVIDSIEEYLTVRDEAVALFRFSPNSAQTVRTHMRKLQRILRDSTKKLENIANRVLELQSEVQAPPDFPDDVTELMFRGCRMAELMMPDILLRSQLLNMEAPTEFHAYRSDFIQFHIAHLDPIPNPARHLRVCVGFKQVEAGLQRLPADLHTVAKEAFVWPMRNPCTHFIGMLGAGLLALKRHLGHLRLRIRQNATSFESALGEKMRSSKVLENIFEDCEPEIIRRAVRGAAWITHLNTTEREWYSHEVSLDVLRPPTKKVTTEELVHEPIRGPWK